MMLPTTSNATPQYLQACPMVPQNEMASTNTHAKSKNCAATQPPPRSRNRLIGRFFYPLDFPRPIQSAQTHRALVRLTDADTGVSPAAGTGSLFPDNAPDRRVREQKCGRFTQGARVFMRYPFSGVELCSRIRSQFTAAARSQR